MAVGLAGDQIEVWSGSTNSTSPRHCRSMTVFFSWRNVPASMRRSDGVPCDEHDVRLTRLSRWTCRPAARRRNRRAAPDRVLAGRLAGSGSARRGRAAESRWPPRAGSHQPLVDLGQAVGDQAEGHVDLLDERVLGPAQEADQPSRPGRGPACPSRRRERGTGHSRRAWRRSSARRRCRPGSARSDRPAAAARRRRRAARWPARPSGASRYCCMARSRSASSPACGRRPWLRS